jgi:pimeloyl-ACP methyl ester carboxylesterase
VGPNAPLGLLLWLVPFFGTGGRAAPPGDPPRYTPQTGSCRPGQSEEIVRANWNTAVSSAPVAAYAVVPTWIEDFRPDVPTLASSGLPVLVLHGTADNSLPIDATGRRFRDLVPPARYIEIEGAAHGLLTTHADEVTTALVEFVND